MDTPEQVAAREAKIRLVGDILAEAGCSTLYDSMTVEQAERLAEAITTAMDEQVVESWTEDMQAAAHRTTAATIVHWAVSMARDAPPGSVRYVEGWNASLECLANRIAREFGL